jgi:acyl-CoA synthetase (AMP-forming)/AMP-acid ligase II
MGHREVMTLHLRATATRNETDPANRAGRQETVFSVLARHAAIAPGAPALSGAGQAWSYGRLIAESGAVAARLVALVGTDARVAVVADNHPVTCLVYLACARAGLVVSLVNSRFRQDELAVVFAKLEPHLVIADAAHRADVDGALDAAGLAPKRATLERDGDGRDSVDGWTGGPAYAGPEPTADSILEITWTSGTTSAPKGAMLTHATALYRAACEAELFGLGSDDTAAVITPLFHQSGIRNTVLASWAAGGHAVVLPRFDAASFWADMARFRVTYLCMVETILLMLERNPPSEAERNNTLRRVLAAGDPNVVRRCEQRFGFRVVQVWGMTETGVSTGVPRALPMERVNMLRDWGNGAPLAGWALGESKVRLVRDGAVVEGEGAQGEIQFASPMLFSRYFRDEAATASAFDGEWFKTGDLGMYGPDGALYFLDRIKDVIRRGGENIASKQVEDVLALHPRVAKAAVIPVPDPLFMQEVMAVVVADGTVSADELWAWCDARLARYKVPRYLRFVDALPVNGSGRVQKQVLAKAAMDAGVIDRRAEGRMGEAAS